MRFWQRGPGLALKQLGRARKCVFLEELHLAEHKALVVVFPASAKLSRNSRRVAARRCVSHHSFLRYAPKR